MYNYNGWFMRVACLCGREHLVKRAMVCSCGTTLRIRHTPGRRGAVQPLAVAQDKYNLLQSPNKKPIPVGWEFES